MTDEQLYLQATEEAQSSERDKALWAKAMALTLGNENHAMYKYVELRVLQIAQSSTHSSVTNTPNNTKLDASTTALASLRSKKSASRKQKQKLTSLDNSASRVNDKSSQIDIVLDQTMAFGLGNVDVSLAQTTQPPILKAKRKISSDDARNKSKTGRFATDSKRTDLSANTTVPRTKAKKNPKHDDGDVSQQSDRIQFADVDIDQKTTGSKVTPTTSNKNGQLHPWRRNIARFVDFWTVGMFFGICVAYLISLGHVTEPLILFLAMRLTWILVEAASLSILGTTPAKWIFGIKVRNSRGKKLPFGIALQRTLQVWLAGEGLNIPILSLITRVIAYRTLTQYGITSWDETYRCVITHKKWNWWRATMCVVCLIGAVSIMAMLFSFYRLQLELF